MDEKRKGEIAYILLKYRLFREGIPKLSEIKREIGNISKETDIPPNELKEFVGVIVKDVVTETFGRL